MPRQINPEILYFPESVVFCKMRRWFFWGVAPFQGLGSCCTVTQGSARASLHPGLAYFGPLALRNFATNLQSAGLAYFGPFEVSSILRVGL